MTITCEKEDDEAILCSKGEQIRSTEQMLGDVGGFIRGQTQTGNGDCGQARACETFF